MHGTWQTVRAAVLRVGDAELTQVVRKKEDWGQCETWLSLLLYLSFNISHKVKHTVRFQEIVDALVRSSQRVH